MLTVTGRCNLACKHCYRRADEVIDLADISLALNKLEEVCPYFITVSGGEPLLLGEEIFVLAKELKQICRVLYLTTNGTLVNKFPAALFKVFDEVQISLDGPEEIHDAIRGTGVFHTALNAARYLQPVVAVSFLCTINSWNFRSLEALKETTEKTGVMLKIERMSGYGIDGLKPLEHPKDWQETLEKAWKLNIVTDDPLDFWFKQRPKAFFKEKRIRGGCMAGIGSLAVSPTLDVFPCVRLRVSVGNLKKETMREIWLDSPLLNQLRVPLFLKGKCAGCPYLSLCRGCRADVWARSGDIFGPDPLCWLEREASVWPAKDR